MRMALCCLVIMQGIPPDFPRDYPLSSLKFQVFCLNFKLALPISSFEFGISSWNLNLLNLETFRGLSRYKPRTDCLVTQAMGQLCVIPGVAFIR